LAAAILVAVLALGGYWYFVGRHYQTTDDAYLGADSVTIAPKVGGYIRELSVADNQAVHKGDVLARIDPRDYQTAIASATANLENAQATAANIDAQLNEQKSSIAQAQAAVDADQAAVTFAQQELARYADLARAAVGTVQRQQQAQSDVTQRRAALERDKAALQAALAHVAVLQTQREQAVATIDARKAALAQAEINLGETTIRSPADGVIGDRTTRQGQFVQPGTRLMSVVPTGSIYVVANYKETQTGEMTPGQPASIRIDSFPGQTIKGRVDSLAPGTGAQFALLPPENATGNFVKIVQRVPVRIVLEPGNPLIARLRPGLSATVTVDIHDKPPVSQASLNHPSLSQAGR
jgi:membrane fusion protein (multidrug efflux system)